VKSINPGTEMSPWLVEIALGLGGDEILAVGVGAVAVAVLEVLPAILLATALAAFLRLLDSLGLAI
jgi:hypothetical protein